jgi:hypothetical protein
MFHKFKLTPDALPVTRPPLRLPPATLLGAIAPTLVRDLDFLSKPPQDRMPHWLRDGPPGDRKVDPKKKAKARAHRKAVRRQKRAT